MAREMKDSGIPWIGRIPVEWDIGKVSYFFDIQLGKMLQPEANTEEDTFEEYLCAANLGGNRLKTEIIKKMWFSPSDKDKFDVRKGDLLVVEGGDVASCDIVREDVHNLYIQNALHRVRSIAGFDVRYLKYLLILAKSQGYIDLICNKATIAHFTKDKFASIPYPVIPIKEQEQIASFLDYKCDQIDAVIEKTRASIEEYKKLKQAVITQAVTKGIRSERLIKDSGIEWIGNIPDSWDCTLLKRHCAFQTGSTPSTANERWFNGELDWFTPADFNDKYYLTDSSRKLSSLAREDGVATMIPQNTVMIIGIGGTAGRIGYTTKECSCNQQITAIKADDKVYPKYLMYWMIANTTRLKDTALYTTLPIINNQTIGQYPFLVPDTLEEQVEIADYLDSKIIEIETLIEKKEEIILYSEKYKKTLIYEYVTGKKEGAI